MIRVSTRGRVVLRLLLAALACLTGFATPATAVLHGIAHAREHAQVVTWVTDARETSPHAPRSARAAWAHVAPSLDAADDDDHHPALHAQLVAKPRIDLAAVLLARASPVLPVVVAVFDAPRPVALGVHAWSGPRRSSTQPRAPPLG